MNQIAFISDSNFIYWNSLILMLAGICGVCLFIGLYLHKESNLYAAFITPPVAIALSLVLSRFIHWYCRAGSYTSLHSAMTVFTDGSFALVGVFAGCLLTAVLLRLLRLHKNLPKMLDCMAVAGAAAITLGRMACFFTNADRGQIIESTQSLPWVYPVVNSVSGALEYRLATFVIQAILAFVLFLVLGIMLLSDRKGKRPCGDISMIFLLCYGASQILLDSTRYDSLYFRSNGFVSVVQVLSAVALVFVIVWFSIQMVRKRGFKLWFLAFWLGIAGAIGCAGYMEYYVQRHGSEALFAYTVMGICLAVTVVITLVIRMLALTGHKKVPKYLATKSLD